MEKENIGFNKSEHWKGVNAIRKTAINIRRIYSSDIYVDHLSLQVGGIFIVEHVRK